MTTFEKVQHAVAAELGVELDEVKPECTLIFLGAESLDMAALLTELEDQFQILIPNDDLKHFRTIQDIVDYADSRSRVN